MLPQKAFVHRCKNWYCIVQYAIYHKRNIPSHLVTNVLKPVQDHLRQHQQILQQDLDNLSMCMFYTLEYMDTEAPFFIPYKNS